MGAKASKHLLILGGPLPSVSAKAEGLPFAGYDKHLLESTLARCGFIPSQVHFRLMHPTILDEINQMDLRLIVTLGNEPMELLTGRKSIDKWHMSPLDSLPGTKCHKVLPTFAFKRMNAQYDHRMFFFRALDKAKDSMYFGPWKRKATVFHHITEPDDLLIHKYLKDHATLSVDIETSQGTINTMGFAWSPNEAIAVRVEPGFYAPKVEKQFWDTVAGYMENPEIRKILQNNIYEGTYFARYGIRLRNVWHDTMWAQKLLYPEFKQGLDMVGRLFTNEIYWKEDGKDWSKIDNWPNHLTYNCKDTTGTMEGAINQRKELEERDLLDFFDGYMMKLAEPLIEMCCHGLRLDPVAITKAKVEVDDIALLQHRRELWLDIGIEGGAVHRPIQYPGGDKLIAAQACDEGLVPQ